MGCAERYVELMDGRVGGISCGPLFGTEYSSHRGSGFFDLFFFCKHRRTHKEATVIDMGMFQP